MGSPPVPGNMENCDPKCKCLTGPYTNRAYSCDNPCDNGCDFDCENGCECGTGSQWVITVSGPADPAYAGCGDCTPPSGTVFVDRLINFGSFVVTPTGSAKWCSLSCESTGRVNCGTWRSQTGGDWIWIGDSPTYSGDQDGLCGVSDGLAQNFTITESPTAQRPPGTIISVVLFFGSTGAIGCCFPYAQVVGVELRRAD